MLHNTEKPCVDYLLAVIDCELKPAGGKNRRYPVKWDCVNYVTGT